MDKDKFLSSGLLEQYVLGLTSPEESKKVEEYANAFPEIQEEINTLRKAIEEYAKQYAIDPPENVKSKIMEEIDDLEAQLTNQEKEQRQQALRSRSRTMVWLAAAGFALAILFGVTTLVFYEKNNLNRSNYRQLTERFEAFQQECETMKSNQSELERTYAFLKHSKTVPVKLEGTSLAPDAMAIVYLNREQENALLNIVNLPTPPPGKQYQIWADVEGEMINMGTFQAETDKFQIVNFIENAESLNITLEPEGGSEHPTVELLYVNGEVG